METNQIKLILTGGICKAIGTGDEMKIEGWASTSDMDFAGDIVEPNAFSKSLSDYKKKGRYWFNHDPKQVLGVVKEITLESKGLYIKEAQLSDTPFNREYIWPHVKMGALNEHSIQFYSNEPTRIKDAGYRHTDAELVEVSIVSIACNPSAGITGMKSLMPAEEYYKMRDMDSENAWRLLLKLNEEGTLRMPSEFRTSFFMGGSSIESKTSTVNNKEHTEMVGPQDETKLDAGEAMTPDFADFTLNTRALKEDTGEEVAMPIKAQKDYDNICSSIYLGKSAVRDTYLFKIGVPTDNGFKYDFKSIALSFADVLGVKGHPLLSVKSKNEIVNSILALYTKLNKSKPKTLEGVALDKLTPEAIGNLKYKDLEWLEGEDVTVATDLFTKNVKQIQNAVKFLTTKEGVRESISKDVYGSMSLSLYAYELDDAKTAQFIVDILGLLSRYKDAENADDDVSVGSFLAFANTDEATKKSLESDEDESQEDEDEDADEVDVAEDEDDSEDDDDEEIELTEEELDEITEALTQEVVALLEEELKQ